MDEIEEFKIDKETVINSEIDENRKKIGKTVFIQAGITAGLLGALAIAVNVGVDPEITSKMTDAIPIVNGGILTVSIQRISAYLSQIKKLKKAQSQEEQKSEDEGTKKL